MATLVGTEKDLLHLLNNLIELDYDAIEAYEAAITRLKDVQSKDQLRQFMGDHQRHTVDVGGLVRNLGGEPAQKADFRRVLTKGKVVLAGLVGDATILRAMKSNEDDTNTAYERAVEHPGLPENVRQVLDRNLADERRHRAWIEQRMESFSASQAAHV